LIVPTEACRTRHDDRRASDASEVDGALDESVAVLGVWVETVLRAPTSGVAEVVCGTRKVALGHDGQGEKGEGKDHFVRWRRRWDNLERLRLSEFVRGGLLGAI
jgi:hypothetical protein